WTWAWPFARGREPERPPSTVPNEPAARPAAQTGSDATVSALTLTFCHLPRIAYILCRVCVPYGRKLDTGCEIGMIQLVARDARFARRPASRVRDRRRPGRLRRRRRSGPRWAPGGRLARYGRRGPVHCLGR